MKVLIRFCLTFLLLPVSAHAQQQADEGRRLLEEGNRQSQQYRESGWLGSTADHTAAAETAETDDGYIRINGQIYAVGNTAEELESALYHAINYRQWHKTAQFSARYAALPDHKPALLQLAAGLQARETGDYTRAAAALEQAAAAEPDNVRIGLERARIYTEDNQNREAAAVFRQVLDSDIPAETRALVKQYLHELDKRARWHGQLSVGYGHNDNINQGNGLKQCVWNLADMCLIERTLPKPVASALWQYSATAMRTLPLSGHHGLHLRTLAYGTHYRREDPQQPLAPDYGYDTAALYAGYDYADARNHVSLLPYFEYDRRNGHTHYRAWGGEAEWSRSLSPRWRISVRGAAKRYGFSGQSRRYFADYTQYEAGLGAEWAAGQRWGLFAHWDGTRKAYTDGAADSKEYAVRLGAYKLFGNGAYANLMLMHRRSRDDEAGFVSNGERRSDRQDTAVAAVGLANWQYRGIYPELRWKHTRNRSNADVYRYRQNEAVLSLRYRF